MRKAYRIISFEAAVTADYSVKIHKVLKQFVDKIDSKYLTEKGYYPEDV